MKMMLLDKNLHMLRLMKRQNLKYIFYLNLLRMLQGLVYYQNQYQCLLL